ncbi:MAG: hypothetical protein LBV43_05470 [Prevotella sp.]|jgi:hypothetical protein|nr:hypothetical protein [Prevotella sp.]
MGQYTFKEQYTDLNGTPIGGTFFSTTGVGTVGSREFPRTALPSIALPAVYTNNFIFGYGYFNNTLNTTVGYYSGFYNIIGQGIGKTVLKTNISAPHAFYGLDFNFKDLTIENLNVIPNDVASKRLSFFNCEIREIPTLGSVSTFNSVSKCLMKGVKWNIGQSHSYVDVDNQTIFNSNLNIYDGCMVRLSASDITSTIYRNLYIAFNDCRFLIANEAEASLLTPVDENNNIIENPTESDYRNEFVRRCQIQGISLPYITDYNETIPIGRWVFANGSAINGLVLRNSIINNFEKRRFIFFGYNSERSEKIEITNQKNIPASISASNPSQGVVISDGSISLSSDVDISKRTKSFFTSNIIWLGGMSVLNSLKTINNFPEGYGIILDNKENMAENPTLSGNIQTDKTYIIRSNNPDMATVTYDGKTYNSSIGNRNNVFRGTSITTFVTSSNAVVYEILDEVQYQTVGLRIVNKIPETKITSGNLTNGYWYLVEHDNEQSNTTDYITYKGVNYPSLSSFLVDASDLTFSKTGSIHLRRCWKDDFDSTTETLDKTFWQNGQKPKWVDVLPEDPRCLMKGNTDKEVEMQTDTKDTYIASGHPDFYKYLLELSGTKKPAFQIRGTYMQCIIRKVQELRGWMENEMKNAEQEAGAPKARQKQTEEALDK